MPWALGAGLAVELGSADGVAWATDGTYAPWLAHAVVPQSTGVTVLPTSCASEDSEASASGDSVSLTSGASLASSSPPVLVDVTVVTGELSATVVATTAALPPAVAATAIPAMVAALALVLRMRSTFVRSIRKPSCEGRSRRGAGSVSNRSVLRVHYT